MGRWPLIPGRVRFSPRHFVSPLPAHPPWLHSVRLSSSSRQPSIASLLPHNAASTSPTTGTLCDGDTITINGFVRSIRRQKRVAFAAIGDGSSLESLQAVLSPEQAEGLSTGAAVTITGQWKLSPAGKQQARELHASNVRIMGQHDSMSYPLQKKYHTAEFLRGLPHLRARLPFNALLLRLRSHIIAQLTCFFAEREFVQTHPPIITSSDCEGAGEVFTVSTGSPHQPFKSKVSGAVEHFFRTPKYLTVSSQLHLEALAQSVGKVWTLSPTFRAEKSDTPRHLSEFYMLEAEAAFVENVSEIMDLVEDMLRFVARGLLESHIGSELLQLRAIHSSKDSEEVAVTRDALLKRWQGLADGPWPRITYADAIVQLQEAMLQRKVTFEFVPTFDSGLQAEHEKYLAAEVGKGPLFITDYPRSIKAFYMAPSSGPFNAANQEPTVACFDLIVPEICELVGGSMREYRLPELLESMERKGMRKPGQYSDNVSQADTDLAALRNSDGPESVDQPLQWYLDLRRYGSVPHGGFGLGFDRLLGYLSGVSNIREVVGFPRWHGRCDC